MFILHVIRNHVPFVHETFATTTCFDILTGRCLHRLLTLLCRRWRKSGGTLHIGDEEVVQCAISRTRYDSICYLFNDISSTETILVYIPPCCTFLLLSVQSIVINLFIPVHSTIAYLYRRQCPLNSIQSCQKGSKHHPLNATWKFPTPHIISPS